MLEGGRLRFGVAIPQTFPDGKADLTLISNFLSKAEALGYESGWVLESMITPLPSLSPLELLSYAAAFCTRLKLGTSVMLTALRDPIHTALSTASLDQLCNGRLILGIGLGPGTDIYPAFGIPPKGRASRFEEGIALLKRAWTNDEVTFHGRFWQMDNLPVGITPVQKPHPPIWFGGQSAPALRRAAKLGNGWMGAGAISTRAFKEQIRMIRQYLEEEGRDPASFELSKRVYIAVDKNRERGFQKLQERLGRHYGNSALAEEVSVFGSEEECLEGLAEVVAQGIDLLLVHPVYEMIEQAEHLATDVLPKLQ